MTAVVDLQLDAVTVGIAVVERERWPVIDRPLGLDAASLHPAVGVEELVERVVLVADVIQPHAHAGLLR
jgi:hypothetical protein